MALTIFSTRQLFVLLTDSRYRNYWRFLIIFMFLFQFGYIIALLFTVLNNLEILALLTGVIMLFGALFVFFVVRLGHLTISDMMETSVSKSYVENILSTIPDVMIVATPSRTIHRLNIAALSVTGYKSHELLGQPLDFLFPDLRMSTQDCIDNKAFYEGQIKTKSGALIPASLSISVIFD